MASQTTATVSGWDFHNFHVQQDVQGGSFINAESILVACGAPEPANNITSIATAGGNATETAYPFGLLENVGISQSKQLQRIFEIGSSRSYFVPGRVMGSLSLGRIMYHGPSMLRILYAYYNFDASQNFGNSLLTSMPTGNIIDQAPGYDDIFLNLGSDLFNYPTGLVLYFRDQADTDVAGIYLTSCYLMGHQFSISSGSILVMEGSSLQYDRMIPVKLTGGEAANSQPVQP